VVGLVVQQRSNRRRSAARSNLELTSSPMPTPASSCDRSAPGPMDSTRWPPRRPHASPSLPSSAALRPADHPPWSVDDQL